MDQVEWIYRYMGRKIFAKPVDRHQGVASYAGDGLRSLYTSTVQVSRWFWGTPLCNLGLNDWPQPTATGWA